MATIRHCRSGDTSNDFLKVIADLRLVLLDHSYAKSCFPQHGSNNNRAAKSVFVPKINSHESKSAASEELQVDFSVHGNSSRVEFKPKPVYSYDVGKARKVMTECEKHIGLVVAKRSTAQYEDIEEISRAGWTCQQNELFNTVIQAINSCRLSKLTYESHPHEPIMRRVFVDKAARKVRQVFAFVRWDPVLLQWLHSILMKNLTTIYLSSYLDILQTLRAKCPSLVDKMVSLYASDCQNQTATEAVQLLLNRRWDPLVGTSGQSKSVTNNKESNSPLLLLVPNSPTHSMNSLPRRLRTWQNYLANYGKVVLVTIHSTKNVNVSQCLDHMVGAVRTKILELKCHFTSRPIVLIGWGVGAAIACKVALIESVSAIVCMGFPIMGLDGIRGDIEDPLLALTTPTLFVTGTDSRLSSPDDIEDFRQNMKADTSLFIVGGADEQLRISHHVKKRECVTQAIADKLIQNEVVEFLSRIFNRDYSNDEYCVKTTNKLTNQKKRRKINQDSPKCSTIKPSPKSGVKKIAKVSAVDSNGMVPVKRTNTDGEKCNKNFTTKRKAKGAEGSNTNKETKATRTSTSGKRYKGDSTSKSMTIRLNDSKDNDCTSGEKPLSFSEIKECNSSIEIDKDSGAVNTNIQTSDADKHEIRDVSKVASQPENTTKLLASLSQTTETNLNKRSLLATFLSGKKTSAKSDVTVSKTDSKVSHIRSNTASSVSGCGGYKLKVDTPIDEGGASEIESNTKLDGK